MFMLAGGMALAIPTTVAVLSATAYEPPADYVQDRAPADEPVAEPPQPSTAPGQAAPPGTQAPGAATPTGESGSLRLPKSRAHAHHRSQRLTLYRPTFAPALLGVRPDGYLTLRIPAVEVREMYTALERFQFGIEQRTELHVALFDVVF
jgi:hypothetical protein